MPDSDATDHAADLNDFLSSRSGTSEAAGIVAKQKAIATIEEDDDGKVKVESSTVAVAVQETVTIAQVLTPADNALLGFEEALPRTRRKEDGEFEPHSPLIKLTPFSEEQRRAMVSKGPEATGDRPTELTLGAQESAVVAGGTRVQPEEMTRRTTFVAAVTEVGQQQRRKSMPTEASAMSAKVRKRSLVQDVESAPTSAVTHLPYRRRSLRQQESIDRVTRYLDEHQQHQQQDNADMEEEVREEARQLSAESRLFEEEKRLIREAADAALEKLTRRRANTVNTATIADDYYYGDADGASSTTLAPSFTSPTTHQPTPAIDLLTPERTEEASAAKKRSSLRRRREDPAESVVKDAQGMVVTIPIETTKKTVRISSVEEEIRIESFDSVDMDELGPFAEPQQVQLVTTKYTTAEELADTMAKRDDVLQSPLKAEAAAISKLAIERSTGEIRLQLPPTAASIVAQSLKPSASENALTAKRTDENKISEKNIKPEILMDLSRVTSEEPEDVRLFDDQLLQATRPKRKLSRVSSDSACRIAPEVKFHVGGGGFSDDEPPSLRHSQTDLTSFGMDEKVEPPRIVHRGIEVPVATVSFVGERESDSVGDRGLEIAGISEPKKCKSTEDVASASSREDFSSSLRRSSSDSSPFEEGRSRQRHRRQRQPQALIVPGSKAVDQRLRNRSIREALVPKEEPPPGGDKPARYGGEDSHATTIGARDTAVVPPVQGTQQQQQPRGTTSTENGLIVREHSLKYQRQTLGSPASLEDLLATDESSPVPVEELEAETLDYSSTQSLLSASYKSYGSPKREVETQTQGEHKSTQYELEDLAELVEDLYDRSSDSRERLELLLEARFGSPRREVEVQTEQESKGVQCVSEELAASGEFGPFFRRQLSFGSPRREAQVQTGQDTKCTQCDFSEFEDGNQPLDRVQWREPISTESKAVGTTRAVECSASSVDSSPGSSSPQRKQLPLIVLVKGGATLDMTVTHRDKDGNVVWAKHWGPERLVEIYREPQTSLGLSIVGGKVDLQDSSSSSKSQNVSGIFIKNVLPNSPAGRAGGLQTGDRIIEVDGVDLRNSTHERAVKAIQAAGNPVRLLVQSLVHLSPDNEGPTHDRDGGSGGGGGGSGGHRTGARRQSTRNRMPADGGSPTSSFRPRPGSPSRSPEVIQEGRPDLKRQGTGDGAGPSGRRSSMKKSMRKKAPSPPPGGGVLREVSEEREDKPKSGPAKQAATESAKSKYSSGESSEEEDTREMEGNVYTKGGVEISRKSAGNVKRSKEEIAADPEEEDEFGYTTNKVKKKYGHLKSPVFLVKLEKDRRGLGISLAGHKDRNKMAVFICGLNPSGVAHANGQLKVGDELLEVNGAVFQGRCHLNVSSMIKGMPFTTFKLVIVRKPSGADHCAVKQVLQFPTALAGEDYSMYKGVRAVPIKKGTYGLGIMIIEGKHAEVGQGIFVSDIQEGSAAEQAGLNVGDMILAVNADTVQGATYEEATALLKKAEGVVTLTVCNPNQSKVAEDEERKARGEPVEPAKVEKKEPDKPKEPEPPADPKDCKINPNKDTTIEFPKDKDKPIGFTVVGGNDTPINGVFVLDVFPDGAAGKDGRLQPGDRIVDINKESFKAVDQEKAYQTVLRITQGPIIMIVHRDEKAVEEFEVELSKKPGKGSGLCLMGYKSGKGAYVSEVVTGGSAAESGKIVKGDRIVAVGGQDLREAPVEDIALHVKVSNPVQLKLARYKSK